MTARAFAVFFIAWTVAVFFSGVGMGILAVRLDQPRAPVQLSLAGSAMPH